MMMAATTATSTCVLVLLKLLLAQLLLPATFGPTSSSSLLVAAKTALPAKITGIERIWLSQEGGTQIKILGTGFARGGVEGRTDVYIGSQVCDVVEYYSNDHQLVCTTRPSMLTGAQPVRVALTSVEFSGYAACATNCVVYFQADKTPSISSYTYSVGAGDEMVLTGALKGVYARQYDIRLGGRDGAKCELVKESDEKIMDIWHRPGRSLTWADVIPKDREGNILPLSALEEDRVYSLTLRLYCKKGSKHTCTRTLKRRAGLDTCPSKRFVALYKA